MKKVLIIFLVAIPSFVWGVWFAFPEHILKSFVEKSISTNELSVEVESLKKGLFYSFTINRLTLLGRKEELVYLNDISCSLQPWVLVFMNLRLSFNGQVSGGNMNGKMDIARNKKHISLDFRDARIKNIPFFSIAGIKGDGSISGRFVMNDNTGFIEFFSKDIALESAIFSGISVPLNYFQKVIGSLNIRGKEIFINSVTLEGIDIYARIKGDIKDTFYNINIELMPGKSFIDNPLFSEVLKRYEVSPGYYVVPLRGKL
ncbi:MAG: type II secretion system protein GspN [Nitrospirae bacterium]|nr:type II secretion system protein GspN [Nitrospirota bacterium]